jgi:hypothetical protein
LVAKRNPQGPILKREFDQMDKGPVQAVTMSRYGTEAGGTRRRVACSNA